MFGIFSKRVAKSSQGSQASKRTRLEVQHLEDRLVPTTQLVGGHLLIYGDVRNTTYATVELNDNVRVDLVNGNYRVTQNGRVSSFAASSVTGQILFKGFGGDDSFVNNTLRTSYAYGGAGNDYLVGGTSLNYLYGEDGDDTLYGRGTADYLYGENGNDILVGGYDFGPNHLDGGAGNDILFGGYGIDQIYGGAGNDTIYGEAGNDIILGGEGNDTIYGGTGDDSIRGQQGLDKIYGGAGNDKLFGGDDTDYLYGEAGNDYLDAGSGTYYHLTGGTGADTFVIYPPQGWDALGLVAYWDFDIEDYNAGEGDRVIDGNYQAQQPYQPR